MNKPVLSEMLAWPILLLFLYTGLSKLGHIQDFSLQLRNSPWHLLSSLSITVAWLLPLAEILIAAMLIWLPTRKSGFIFSTVLFTLFILYISILLGSDKKLPCSCGGIISYLNWKEHLLLNTVLSLLSLAGTYLEHKRKVSSISQ